MREYEGIHEGPHEGEVENEGAPEEGNKMIRTQKFMSILDDKN